MSTRDYLQSAYDCIKKLTDEYSTIQSAYMEKIQEIGLKTQEINLKTLEIQYIKKMQEIYLCGGDLLSEYNNPAVKFSIYINSEFGRIFLNHFYAAEKPLRCIITDTKGFQQHSPLVSGQVMSITFEETGQIPETDIIIIAAFGSVQDNTFCTNAKLVYLTELIDKHYLRAILIDPIDKLLTSTPAQLVYCSYPLIGHIKNKSEHEKMLCESADGFAIEAHPLDSSFSKFIDPVFRPHGFDDEYIESVVGRKPHALYFNTDETTGFRFVKDMPVNPDGNIYILGNSLIFGAGTDDSNTIAGSLQRYINEWSAKTKKQYAAHNFSCVGGLGTRGLIDTLKQISFKENDIAVCFYYFDENTRKYMRENYNFCDTQDVFERPHAMGEICYDGYHMNFVGYNAIAKTLFNFFLEKHALSSDSALKKTGTPAEVNKSGLSMTLKTLPAAFDDNEDLSAYIEMLSSYKKNVRNIGEEVIGAIVMNCNPFTQGHRYLIETAAKQADCLYIFVVEEDKSFFPFKDRFELVKQGTADMGNVVVLPSGKFIISTLTFGAYFEKNDSFTKVIDSSLDITVFAEKIAPVLNITKRFLGEEPLCNVTRQYNAQMQSLLPSYGIEVIVVGRKESDGVPISASYVRDLLYEKNFEKIAEIVPKTTLDYLVREFGE